eukprot:TRINITY_DN6546_c0_g1_i1.p1 TRINITY_DN6546_c0_g1~~TRINITY_DN6546_c0_g1_i1.p1  ORF type:complete len:447 (-),score=74.75 TRINITY_DN6546_c0_g1_i1:144-1484(-)
MVGTRSTRSLALATADSSSDDDGEVEPSARSQRSPPRVRKVQALKQNEPGVPMAPEDRGAEDADVNESWLSLPLQASRSVAALLAASAVWREGEDDGGELSDDSEESEQVADSYRYCNVVRCPSGHAMHGKVIREILGRFRCGSKLCNPKSYHCANCGHPILDHEMKYRCERCNVTYCTQCSRERLGLPTALRGSSECVEVLPGDMFFCGPDILGIHHVVLATSELVPEPEVGSYLDIPPGMEVWGCDTIESVQDCRGDRFEWYPARSYFGRDPFGPGAFLVADMPQRRGDIEAIEPLPLKLLLSPLRKTLGGPGLNEEAFAQAVRQGEESSKAYSYATRVSMGVAYLLQQASLQQASLDPRLFPSPRERAELLRLLERTWAEPPICSSVPVQTWQRYLLNAIDDRDLAAQAILRYMPLLSNNVLPATLVKELTKRGWVLKDSIEP